MKNDPPPPMPLWQRIELTKRIIQILALSVMVGLRPDLGYRFVNPVHLILVTLGMVVAASIAAESASPFNGSDALMLAACFVFVLGLAQRSKRAKEMRQGVLQHSYYVGTSIFSVRWLPLFVRRNRRVERFFDPLFCLLSGAVLLQSEHALGVWFILAGACLRFLEATVQRNERHLSMDMADNLVTSQVQSQNMEQYEESLDIRPQQRMTGIPTGLASDVHAHIRRRKKAKRRWWF